MVIGTGKIIQGYCHVIETGEKLRYYWVEDSEGNKHDVAFQMAAFANSQVKDLLFTLSMEEPTPGTYQTDKANDDMFEMYQKNPKEFWKKIQT